MFIDVSQFVYYVFYFKSKAQLGLMIDENKEDLQQKWQSQVIQPKHMEQQE